MPQLRAMLCLILLAVGTRLALREPSRCQAASPDGPSTARTHWSYARPQRPPRPPIQQAGWPRGDIDYFVLARLEKEGLAPSPTADKATLIRRVYLDLLGLPPTPSQVGAFLANDGLDAYEQLVDRLLQSPHYAERMATWWLDMARYADTQGYEGDGPRQIWLYRDWVIDAFARHMPFDRFTIEQLAGDLIPEATVYQRVATGFHCNSPFCFEAGTDFEQFRVESVVDRVNTTMTVWWAPRWAVLSATRTSTIR